MTLLLGLAWGVESLDLTLERAEAARDAKDWAAAMELAGEALELDPHDPRAHFAWQSAHVGADLVWRLDAEYAWLIDGDDPRLDEVAEGWLAASGKPNVAVRLRPEDEQPAAQQSIALAMRAGEVAAAKERGRTTLETWPDRPDLLEPLLRDDSLRTRHIRRQARVAADALVDQGDLLSLYRALDVYVAVGEVEAAEDVIALLEAAGEPFPLTPHPAWHHGMMKAMGDLMAMQTVPHLPEGHRPHEEQAALAFTAETLHRKGRHERAAATWRRALEVQPAQPQMVLAAGLGIELGGGSGDELLALADEALAGLSVLGDEERLATAHHLRARALVRLDRVDEALVAATLAAGLGDEDARVLRAQLLELTGHPALAFDAYARAAAAGVPGLDDRLARLYVGPASWQAVVAAWPVPETHRPDSAPKALPREMLGEIAVGDQVMVVNFWASWCSPCQRELPELDALGATGVTIVAVSTDSRPEDMERFLQKHPLPNLETVWDPALAKELGVAGLPTTVIVDSAGLVVWRTQGYIPGDVERLAAELEEFED